MRNIRTECTKKTTLFVLLCILISVLIISLTALKITTQYFVVPLPVMRYKLWKQDHPLIHDENHHQNISGKTQHMTEIIQHRLAPLKIEDQQVLPYTISRDTFAKYKSTQVNENSSSLPNIVKNTSLTVSFGDLKAEHCENSPENIPTICRNLSLDSISHMRAESAKWQPLKTNVSCHFYSAFWETRQPTVNEVRVIGMAQKEKIHDVWCHLWFEKQCHPTTTKAMRRKQTCSRCGK